MSQTTEQRLQEIKKVAQEAQTKRIQLETKLEAARAHKETLLEKCKQFGVKPEELPKHIEEYEAKITKGVADLEALLPTEEKPADDIPY